ncbi:MAG: hypothetical protein ACOX4O_05125 [Eubacteriales bacterium]
MQSKAKQSEREIGERHRSNSIISQNGANVNSENKSSSRTRGNVIFLYDDKVVITYNYREGGKTITLEDITSSDMDLTGAPEKK